MSSPGRSTYRLTVPAEEAVQAILAALPEDAIVRGHDDGVGRFAGERTLVIVGRGERALSMFRGSYGAIKARLEKPQLAVALEPTKSGSKARLTVEPEAKPSPVSRIVEAIVQIITFGALGAAYFMFRKKPIDWATVAMIAVVGGVGWTLLGGLMPKKTDPGLAALVREAIAPHRVRKPSAQAEPDPTDQPSSTPDVEVDATDREGADHESD